MNKYYFFDRGILQAQGLDNVAIHPAQGIKEAMNPLFTEERESAVPKPWEVRYDNSYPNVIWDEKEKLYRLYYTLIVEDKECESTPIDERLRKTYIPRDDRRCALAYAESSDGLIWHKPNLGIVSFQGSKDNNLVLIDTHGAGVFLDENETDKRKRFKMVALKDCPGKKSLMSVSFSQDGIHWEELQAWIGNHPWGDTHNLPFYDQLSRKYKVITREWQYGIRVATTYESKDFLHWSKEGTAMIGKDYEDQVYSMPVFFYNSLYLGLASIFHEGDKSAVDFDCVDCELSYSKNTKDFMFVSPGEAFIPRGKGSYHDGDFDCCCIYASVPIRESGKLHFYYMGGNGRHTNFRETSFARISFEEDKLAYIASKTSEGTGEVVTARFTVEGDKLEILAELMPEASIQCAVYDKWNGKAIQDFDFCDCKQEILSDAWIRLRFSEELSVLNKQNISLIFRVEKAKLYALRGDIKLFNPKY